MFLKFRNVTINTKNLAFVKEKDSKYFCQYRKKASIKEIEIPLVFGDINPSTFFMKYGFYKLEDYYINIEAISFINEVLVVDNKADIYITFVNGLELNLKIDSGRFDVWKNNRLRG